MRFVIVFLYNTWCPFISKATSSTYPHQDHCKTRKVTKYYITKTRNKYRTPTNNEGNNKKSINNNRTTVLERIAACGIDEMGVLKFILLVHRPRIKKGLNSKGS